MAHQFDELFANFTQECVKLAEREHCPKKIERIQRHIRSIFDKHVDYFDEQTFEFINNIHIYQWNYFCGDGLVHISLSKYIDAHQDLRALFTPEDQQHYEPEMAIINYMIVHNFHWLSQMLRITKMQQSMQQMLVLHLPNVLCDIVCEYSKDSIEIGFFTADKTIDRMIILQNFDSD